MKNIQYYQNQTIENVNSKIFSFQHPKKYEVIILNQKNKGKLWRTRQKLNKSNAYTTVD